jgi:hypothetical protein
MAYEYFPQAEYDAVVGGAHAPFFFEKLARDHDIVPSSHEERLALLELAGILQNAQERDAVKRASGEGSFIIGAVSSLKTALGGDPAAPSAGRLRAVKQAAWDLAGDDGLADAALGLGAWLAGRQ